jgi:hypothetical protein
MQPVVPYFKPYKKPLNYPKYKKDSYLDAHVWVFKAIIKANGETIDEEITNLFNFTLIDNALKWCNNYMQDHPNYRFVELKKVFCQRH